MTADPSAASAVQGAVHSAARNRGTYPKGDRRKVQILQAAFETFAAGGYHTASMLQIAAACGVSRAGLLHHFPTKEALLEAVLDERDRRTAELFFRDAPPESEDGVAYFASLLRVVEHNALNPEIVRLFAVLSTEATDSEHPAHAYFVARYERSQRRTRAALGNLAERGLLRSGAARAGLEVDVIALMDGLQVQWLLNPGGTDMPGALRRRLGEIVAVELG
jgi:AcrR family transcriptional regulator